MTVSLPGPCQCARPPGAHHHRLRRTHLSTQPKTPAAARPDSPAVTTPTDPTGRYVFGRQVLALTDRLNGTESYAEAAALSDQVLEPHDGLLARIAEFLEAAGEKAKESENDDGYDLGYDFEEAAVEVRRLGEDLHVAVERMRALGSPGSPPTRAGRHRSSPTTPTPPPARYHRPPSPNPAAPADRPRP